MTSVKNSDIHWLGKVASDWEIAPAWRVMKERGEKSLPDDVHLTPSQTHGVLTQQDYMDRTGNKVVLNLAGTDNMKRVRAGDFIIHLRSFQGGIEASAIDGKVSNAYTVLTPAPDAHFGYYRWFMKSVPLIEGLASSTDQLRDGQSINFSRFSRLSLPFPPLETQRRIADYLDRETAEIDAAVADLDKYVELLGRRRKLIVSSVMTGQMGPISSDLPAGERITKTRPLWNHVRIQNGFPFSADGFSDSGEIPLLRIRDIRGSSFDTYINRESIPSDSYIVKNGNLVVGMDGDFNTVRWSRGDAALNQRVCIIHAKEGTDTRFIEYAIQAPLQLINELKYSTTVKHLSHEDIYRMRVWIPALELQEKIADYLDQTTAEIDSLITESRVLRDLLIKRRSVLITEVVTGRKQV